MTSCNSGQEERRDVFDTFANFLKPFINGRRLELLEILAQGETSVDRLAQLSGMAITTTSNNLQRLKEAGLVNTRREGTRIFYRLSGDDVLELFIAAKKVALRHSPTLASSLSRYLDSPNVSGPTIPIESVSGDTVILDVRPHDEYHTAHFRGAINIPMDELEERIDELPTDAPIAIYCRGELCRLSREAAAYLRDQGLDASAVENGVSEWLVSKEIYLESAH